MKRLVLVTGLCVALVGASQALASGGAQGAAGAVAGSGAKKALNDFAVRFKVKNKDGKPNKVVGFEYGKENSDDPPADDVPMECTTGGSALTFTNHGEGWGPMKIKDHEFDGDFIGNGGTGTNNIEVVITGKFKHHNTQAVGTLHITGDFPPTYSNCDSGVQTWQAGQT